MGAARRIGPGRALAPLSVVAALACAALTGCGSTVSAKDAPPGNTVCAHAGDVDHLTISRIGSFPRNHVYFTFPSKLAPVTVDATGCQQVTGLGPVRWTAFSPDFWSVLATAAGIGPADQATFAGTS